MRSKLEYLRDMARELAALSEADGLVLLAYLFRMAEAEAGKTLAGAHSPDAADVETTAS
jgi:hypothetical protein